MFNWITENFMTQPLRHNSLSSNHVQWKQTPSASRQSNCNWSCCLQEWISEVTTSNIRDTWPLMGAFTAHTTTTDLNSRQNIKQIWHCNYMYTMQNGLLVNAYYIIVYMAMLVRSSIYWYCLICSHQMFLVCDLEYWHVLSSFLSSHVICMWWNK